MTQKTLKTIEEKIGYKFNRSYLLEQAFTRKSYSAEHFGNEDNEKLEFVGDKVIDFIVVKKMVQLFGYQEEDEKKVVTVAGSRGTNFAFLRSEGEMTELKKRIVQTEFFAKSIEKIGLEKYLLMGNGDIKNNVQSEPRVKEDLLEAIVGAAAIDCSWNIEILEDLVERLLNLEENLRNESYEKDYVSFIHEWHQKEYGREPNYEFDDSGNDDVYKCYLFLQGYSIHHVKGFGRSKKEAMYLASKRAYEYLKEKNKIAKRIFDVIENFCIDDAIGKLQMLQDKKIISGLEYIFREEAPTKESNGNPMHVCRCVVDGIDDFVEYGNEKKMLAKKAAAYTMLQILVGRDKMLEKFINYGKEVNKHD